MKDCDRLISMDTTREELLAAGEAEIDSTTEEGTPVQVPRKSQPKGCMKSAKKARIAAAKEHAGEMFSCKLMLLW